MQENPRPSHTNQSMSSVLNRAFRLRCPNCGRSTLFKSYLKPVSSCAACGETFGHIRADDGPSWFALLITSIIVSPGLIALAALTAWPDWALMLAGGSLTVALVLAVLPVAKAIFIAIIWYKQISGSEH
jgi:uncharacterized protein (DUF983 family)